MAVPHIVVRAGHPDFLDLDWNRPMVEWDAPHRLDLPKGISRHEVRFFGYPQGIYAIKELPRRAARNEYEVLRALEDLEAPSVRVVGLVEREWLDPHEEWSAAVITEYLEYSFSYRELIAGPGFGQRRNQMLDGFAKLLVELHLLGCYWGDCSLSNVLYRFDAGAVLVTMVDGETASTHPELSTGQRLDDIEIMTTNVAGGMADIAASQGIDADDADLALGEAIAERYHSLWAEVTQGLVIGPDETYKISEHIKRLNALGFEVEDLELIPVEGGERLRTRLTVAGRRYHSRRLWELTGVDATEEQARQILADLRYYEARRAPSGTLKAINAIRWRTEVFEPLLERISVIDHHAEDPVQAYVDFLHHRYELSAAAERDVGNEEAFESWLAAGQPGYPVG